MQTAMRESFVFAIILMIIEKFFEYLNALKILKIRSILSIFVIIQLFHTYIIMLANS